MKLRLLPLVAVMVATAGCNTVFKHANTAPPARHSDAPAKNGDPAFQSFVDQLDRAVAAHDLQTVASMMTPNFGYRINPPGEGDGVFQYWDENNVWPALQSVLSQKFVPKGNFMVSPPAFATDPQYTGYRAGITVVNGAWKFAYFVKD